MKQRDVRRCSWPSAVEFAECDGVVAGGFAGALGGVPSTRMEVPPYRFFIEPLLRVLAEHPEGIRAAEAHELVSERLGLSDAVKAEVHGSNGQAIYKNRNGWAHDRLKRAGLSESAAYGQWRITRAGIAYALAHPGALTTADLLTLTDVSEPSSAGLWRDRLEAWRASPAARVAITARSTMRNSALSEMRRLLADYLEGKVDMDAFRAEFDARSRGEWRDFGFSGTSGAMVLNQHVKNALSPKQADDALKELAVVPVDDESAARKINDYLAYIAEARALAATKVNLPSPRRLGFFASMFWHIQSPEQWPVMYVSARDELVEQGMYEPTGTDPAADYLAFRTAYDGLRATLGLSTWELESMLEWVRDGDDEDGGTSSAAEHEPRVRPSARVWLMAAGVKGARWDDFYRDGLMSIDWTELGDLSKFESSDEVRAKLRDIRQDGRDPMNDALACWQFAHEMEVGDTVYVKKGRHLIVGQGTIESDYEYQPGRPDPHVRKVKWLKRGEWKPREKALVTKTLTEIGRYPGLVADIRAVTGAGIESVDVEVDDEQESEASAVPYGMSDAEKDLFLSTEDLREIVALCRYKKNVILQGPPGVGKTFIASRLAYLLIESTNDRRIRRVQFHPSYSYEDFVQGLRPSETGGFQRQDGPLLTFCKDALEDQDVPYVLIIDEINRGNVSKILGELLSLIEADKRDKKYGVKLAYSRSDEAPFHVPPNLYIIGMMNTADRSLAFVDYALRRRFVFVDLEPAYSTSRFEQELTRRGVEAPLRKRIVERMTALNERITSDPTLGPGFQIGHSYFCQGATSHDDEWYYRIVKYEIEPLLREYWFDSSKKLEEALASLRDA